MPEKEQRPTINGYEYVGTGSRTDTVEVDFATADSLRRLVVTDFFNTIPPQATRLTDVSDHTVGGKGFYNADTGTTSEVDVFCGLKLEHVEVSSWRLLMLMTRMRRSTRTVTPQRSQARYEIFTLGNEVLYAMKRCQVLFSRGELHIDDENEQFVVPETERKYYERPITPTDCQALEQSLVQFMRRYRVSR